MARGRKAFAMCTPGWLRGWWQYSDHDECSHSSEKEREGGREKEKDRGSHRDEELNRLPKEVVGSPSLEVLQNHVDVALGDVISGHGGGRLVVGLDGLRALFQDLNDLWFYKITFSKDKVSGANLCVYFSWSCSVSLWQQCSQGFSCCSPGKTCCLHWPSPWQLVLRQLPHSWTEIWGVRWYWSFYEELVWTLGSRLFLPPLDLA